MTQNISSAIKTVQDIKDILESEDVKQLIKEMKELKKFLGRFKDINHLTDTLKQLEEMVYICKEFMTIEETAKYMGVSTSKIYKMTSGGDFTPHRITNKMVYLLRDEVNDRIRESRVPSDEEIAAKAEQEAQKYILKTKDEKGRNGRKGCRK